jgi:uroporphyrin-III C-methyltransferase
MKPGKVYLVGAGPGAADLLTVRAAELLSRADIVFHDALVHPDTIVLARRAVRIPVGKRCGRHSTAQQFINKRLIDSARKGLRVVRLKGGDPMLFGRAQEEIDALRAADVEFEIVPGVTSPLAASAEIGVSLTQRGVARSVAFVTPRVGHDEEGTDWVRAAVAADTAVIFMGVAQAAEIASALVHGGMDPAKPVAVVENASLPGQRQIMLTLRELPRLRELDLSGPALILIGDVYAPAVAEASQESAQARCA